MIVANSVTAELVDAEPALRAARRIKTADGIAAMAAALRVAEVGLAAAVSGLAPGVPATSSRSLGRAGQRLCHGGGPHFPGRWSHQQRGP
ncbi:hypothetical protein X011_09340 [Mycobacterium tuberculosis variant microti OV254]|nr:hypothetical protein X011_09340 [Mycobacterium tuberculosis variant microti OV254]BBX43812.1 hypothetical protein MSIM_52630 [Mycobacterium simiae]